MCREGTGRSRGYENGGGVETEEIMYKSSLGWFKPTVFFREVCLNHLNGLNILSQFNRSITADYYTAQALSQLSQFNCWNRLSQFNLVKPP
jgi:hypothetical protein